MKKSLVLFLLIASISCGQEITTPNLDWLLGNWKRTNDKEDKQTFEHWEKNSNQEYIGLGFTLQGKDTVFKENMRLLPIEGVWNLEINGVNEKTTLFYFTKQSENSFVCENPNNEFPKKIEYHFLDKKLKAKVSAGEMEVAFDFEKISK